MEEKIGSLVDALTKLVEKLDDKSTNEVVSDGRLRNPQDDFHDPVKDKEKEFKKQAEIHGKERLKQDKKKKDPRKILKTVMPVSIIDIDKKALKKLAKIMPAGTGIKKQMEKDEPPKTGMLDFLKMVGIGVLAGVLAPVVAFISMFKEIANQKWFITLSKFVKESKIGKTIAQALTTIKKAFMSLGTRFPKIGAMVGKLFGEGGIITGIFTRISTIGKTVMDLVKSTKIGAIAGKVGKFMGKIFAPVMILWGVIETVMGAVKGYKEDGVAGSIKGGVNALFDFLVVDLVNLIVSIPAWFLKKIGLKNVGKALQDNVAGVMQSIKDMFGGIVDTVVGVLTLDPARIIKGLKGSWEGSKDFVGFVIGLAVDPVVNFLKDTVFKWGDPDTPFSFKKDVLDPAVNKVKKWFKGLLTLGDTEDGGWSLVAFINGVEAKVIKFFTDIFAWGEVTDEEGKKTGEWSLGTFIGTIAEKVKVWLTDLFAWADPTDVVFSLVDKAKEVWGKVKAWFTGLIAWAETDVDVKGQKDGFIISSVKGVIKSVKDYFKKLFTFDSAKSTVTSGINILTWLPNLVVSGLGSVSAWFASLFGFDEEAANIKDWTNKFSIGDLVVGAVTKVWEWFKGRFPDASAYITKKWNDFTGNVKDLGSWIWGKVKKVWEWVKLLWDNPKETIEDGWNNLTKNLKSLGDFIWTGLKSAWDWIKNLFTDPKKTIKDGWNNLTNNVSSIGSWLWSKISGIWDWFGDTFPDLKSWVTEKWNNLTTNVSNIGDWVSGKITGIWTWFSNTFPDLSKWITEKWNNLTNNVSNVGEWVGNKIASAWTSLTSLFKTGDISSLVPDGLKDIGSFVWSKVSVVWDSITEVFEKIVDFDVKGYLKKQIKGKGGVVGDKIYDYIFGEEDAAEAAAAKQNKSVKSTFKATGNLMSDAAMDRMAKASENIEKRAKGEAYQDNFEKVYDGLDDLLEMGEGDYLKIFRKIERASQGRGDSGEKEVQELLKRLNIYGADNIQGRRELARKLADGYTGDWMSTDDTNEAGHNYMASMSYDFANRELDRIKSGEMIASWKKQIETEGINLGGKQTSAHMLTSGKAVVTQNMLDDYNKLKSRYESATGVDKENLGYYMKALERVGVTKVLESATPVQSNKYTLDATTELPQLNTDRAAGDIQSAGDSINTGTRNLADVTKDGFPKPGSPYAWEYLRMAGENINDGSRKIFEQSLEYKKSAGTNNTDAEKNQQLLAKKVDRMVEIMTENSETHKKTLEVLEQHGLIDKQGDTVVNNGGNSTVVNNMSIESDIMSFRDRVVGRLNTK